MERTGHEWSLEGDLRYPDEEANTTPLHEDIGVFSKPSRSEYCTRDTRPNTSLLAACFPVVRMNGTSTYRFYFLERVL